MASSKDEDNKNIVLNKYFTDIKKHISDNWYCCLEEKDNELSISISDSSDKITKIKLYQEKDKLKCEVDIADFNIIFKNSLLILNKDCFSQSISSNIEFDLEFNLKETRDRKNKLDLNDEFQKVCEELGKKNMLQEILSKPYSEVERMHHSIKDLFEPKNKFDSKQKKMNFGYMHKIANIMYFIALVTNKTENTMSLIFSINEIEKLHLFDYIYILEQIILLTNCKNKSNLGKNTIFYGPPGTGKTYRVIEEAVKLGNYDFKNENKDRRDIKQEFTRLQRQHQVTFLTFHESFCYEEFIEGIKFKDDKPDIADGIFKVVCINAAYDGLNTSLFKLLNNIIPGCFENTVKIIMDIEENNKKISNLDINKFSDENTQANNVTMYENKKSLITKLINITELDMEDYLKKKIESNEAITIDLIKNAWYIYMKNKELKEELNEEFSGVIDSICTAINEIISQEKSKPSDQTKEKAVIKDETQKSINDIIANLKDNKMKIDFEKVLAPFCFTESTKNHVIIIDEINRGNISKIFGELITLIEEDKRIGQDNQINITLPYSQKEFCVPPNLYMIGTMNSTDKSVSFIDMALRRRFNFELMTPEPHLIRNSNDNNLNQLADIVNILNNRMKLIFNSEDIQLGHSYFMKLKNYGELNEKWKNQIMPLLLETCFEDKTYLEQIFDTKTTNKFVVKLNENENLKNLLPTYHAEFSDELAVKQFKNPKDLWKHLVSIDTTIYSEDIEV